MVYSTRSFQLTRLSYHCPGPMHLDSVAHEIVDSRPALKETKEKLTRTPDSSRVGHTVLTVTKLQGRS